MACVYWIHRPEHTDVFTQGYVGVTSKTAQERYKVHVDTSNAKSSRKSVVHKAIKSIGKDNLIVDTICIAEEWYCYDLENKLRPDKSIGWNVAIGGTKPPGVKGLPVSQETRDKLSKAQKGRKRTPEQIEATRQALIGYKHTDETKAKVSAALRGRKPTEKMLMLLAERNRARVGSTRKQSSKDKQAQTLKDKGWWNTQRANPTIWSQAEWLFTMFHEGWTRYKLARAYEGFGKVGDCLESMWKHFGNGWNPSNDPLWLTDFNKEAVYAPQSA